MQQYALSDIKTGRQIGDFKIVEVYPEGRGGMSRVVRAKPTGDSESQAALKISRTGGNQDYFFAAIQKEVEILQKLDHRGVVRLRRVSAGKNPYKERAVQIMGTPWFFGMECLQGGSLEAYLRGLGPLSLGEAAAICHQVGTSLEYIHRSGFAHNDVKPDNILFRRELRIGDRLEPVLIDFGVAAKLVKPQLDGSVVYMAPERLQESRDPSAPEVLAKADPSKADVWSMGILLYRLLVGREPFQGITDRSITSAILRGMPQSMMKRRQDLPKGLDEFVIEGCLAKDPKLRVDMRDYNAVIDRYSGDWRVQRAPKKKRRLPWQR
ncbi:MAG: serine/threonine-protein kinase [Anaerolineales bacterium]